MEFHETKATTTKRTFNQCAQCGDTLFAPAWSEYVKERCVRHLWSCDACGYIRVDGLFCAAKLSILSRTLLEIGGSTLTMPSIGSTARLAVDQ